MQLIERLDLLIRREVALARIFHALSDGSPLVADNR
jgi:hypothetical protein